MVRGRFRRGIRMSVPFNVEDTDLVFEDDFNDVLTPELFQGYNFSSIALNDSYNIPIPPNVIPNVVTDIIFGRDFNKNLTPASLPEGLELVMFGERFNKSISGVIPSTVKVIMFGKDFNQELRPGDLNNASTIYFGKSFNQDIRGVFSEGVDDIVFGRDFKQPLRPEYFPSYISYVRLDEGRIVLRFREQTAEETGGNVYPLDQFWNRYNEIFGIEPDEQDEDEEEEDEEEDERNKLFSYQSSSMNDLSEETPDIPPEDWEQIKEMFEKEFGTRPMNPSEIILFLDGTWGSLLRYPEFRPVWASRVHDLFTRYTVRARPSGEDLAVNIPDLNIYIRLISLSSRYLMGDPENIEHIIDGFGVIKKWEHHMFEFVHDLLLESYNYPINRSRKILLRLLLIKFLERITIPVTMEVLYNGVETAMEITFDSITFEDGSEVFTRDISKTRVEGLTKYIVEAAGNVHVMEFSTIRQRRKAIVPIESVREGIILMKHPKLTLPLKIFRRLPRSVIESYLKGKFDRLYMTYAPEQPYVVEADIQIPDDIRDLLSPDETVLAGGRLLRMLVGGEFPADDQSHELSDKLNSYIGLTRRNTDKPGDQDYDIYTTRSVQEINEYFRERDYENELDDEELAIVVVSYGGWLTRYLGPDGEKVDVIHVHQHIILDRPICARPQDFITREFDIDITKAWYDGEKVSCMSQKTYQNILDRKMTLDFHPMMSINQYKTRTTMGRIFKYETRGFQFVSQGNEEVIERFTDRLAKISLLAERKNFDYSPEMLVSMIERLEYLFTPVRDRIMEYDRYYVKVREEEDRLNVPVPNPPLVTRPEEHLFLTKVVRRHVDRVEIFDDFFKRVLGISVYAFTGGVYGINLSSIRPSWMNHLHLIHPTFVLRSHSRIDLRSVYRWETPDFDTPRCAEVFTVRGTQPEGVFAEKIKEYMIKCREMEEIQNCFNYVEKMLEYIKEFSAIEIRGGRKTIEVRRGDELLAALRNIGVLHLRYRDLFVKYSGELGIDAGGPAKDFLTSVMRQLRPLFGYVTEEIGDKRMYISNLPDQEIIDNINENLTTKRLTISDLPELYKLAGVMCKSAIINEFNTNIPLSRVLLYIMTSGDMGIEPDTVTSAFILEGKYDLESYILSELYSYEGSVEESAMEKYLIANESKRPYIDMFAAGFSNMSQILKFFKVAAHELYMAICGNRITAESFQSFFTNPSRVGFRFIRPEFIVTKNGNRIFPTTDRITRATDVLMRGEKYTFITDQRLNFDMYLTNSPNPSDQTMNIRFGNRAVYTVPVNAPEKLYLMAIGETFFIEYTIIDNVSSDLLKNKFINYLIGKTGEEKFQKRFREILSDRLTGIDQGLISALKGMMEDLEVPPEPNLMTNDQVVIMYYQLVLKSVTAYTVIGSNTKISVDFNHGLVQLFPHSCFSSLEVSTAWLANSSFEDWLDTGLPAFFEIKYSAA